MVYITPQSKQTCASRRALEIFRDRIFQEPTDISKATPPAKIVRPFKSIQSLSAPAKTHRTVKLPPDDDRQPFLSTHGASGPPKPAPSAKVLRRHKTFHELRSPGKLAGNLEGSEEQPGPLDARSTPLASHTNQNGARAFIPLKCQGVLESASTNGATGQLATSPSIQLTRELQPARHSTPKSTQVPELERLQAENFKPHYGTMARNQDAGSVELRNVNCGLWSPKDFFEPVTRSDVEAGRDENNPVQRVDVTTWWEALSLANAEELFHIHTIFQNALKTILADELRDMAITVQQKFYQGDGVFAHVDGFRVAIEDRWVLVGREQLIHVMTEQAHDFFSAKQYQPNRSALMQLYLSSSECFLDWARCTGQSTPAFTGVALRTFYDQLSKFETPIATAGSFCDYVKILNLNSTPREDQELILVPQYIRDGIFVQSPYPENIKYMMESPISWLAWDYDIKGFRGRVPTYSAFPEKCGLASDLIQDDYSPSHILDFEISAVFTKYCTIGTAHFVRRVRTRLTLKVLPRIQSSSKNSIYGIDCQESVIASSTSHVNCRQFVASNRHPDIQHNSSSRGGSSSDDSACISENHGQHTLREVLLPKSMPALSFTPPDSHMSTTGSSNSKLARKTTSPEFPQKSAGSFLITRSGSSEFGERSPTSHRGTVSQSIFTLSGSGRQVIGPKCEAEMEQKSPKAQNKLPNQFEVIDRHDFTDVPTTTGHEKPNQIPMSSRKAALSSRNTENRIKTHDATTHVGAHSEVSCNFSLADSKFSGVSPERVQSTEHSTGRYSPRSYPLFEKVIGGASNEQGKRVQKAAKGAWATTVERTRTGDEDPDDKVIGPPALTFGSSFSTDFQRRADIEAAAKYTKVMEDGTDIWFLPSLCSPQLSAVSSETKWGRNVKMDTFRNGKKRVSTRHSSHFVEGRLGIEEEMALQEAIKKSSDEQLLRRMAAVGFDRFYDDVFDNESVDTAFDDNSDMNSIDQCPHSPVEKAVVQCPKAKIDDKKHEHLDRDSKRTKGSYCTEEV